MSFDTLPNGGYKCMVKKQRHKASMLFIASLCHTNLQAFLQSTKK